jgi:hypothetical protein
MAAVATDQLYLRDAQMTPESPVEPV